jgi:hypothetical protein
MLVRLAFVLALAGPAFAHSPAIPRTPDGHPDFGGVWGSRFTTTIERMPGATSLAVGEAEAKALGEGAYTRLTTRGAADDPNVSWSNIRGLLQVNGEWRTSQITSPGDGKLPLTQLGKDMLASNTAAMAARPDGPEARSESERCIAGTGRAPLNVVPEDNLREIVQTPGHVAIYTESGGDLRILAFAAQDHQGEWFGNSSASWNRDDLVVTTTGQTAGKGGGVRGAVMGTLIVPPAARVVERLRLLSHDALLYRYTIDDPAIYSAPWSAEYVMVRVSQPIFEHACHEGNYAMVNMLSSARAAERTAAQTSAPSPAKPTKTKAQ